MKSLTLTLDAMLRHPLYNVSTVIQNSPPAVIENSPTPLLENDDETSP